MDFNELFRRNIAQKLAPGLLLVAEPYLSDPNFSRTVIFLCEHGDEGSVGFILNKPTQYSLGDLMEEADTMDIKVHFGGPVEEKTLHMLHRLPIVLNGTEVLPGMYWGGSFDALEDVMKYDEAGKDDMKLFIGYSGWGANQLEHEMKEGSWLIVEATEKLLFETKTDMIWRDAILSLGKDFVHLVNAPANPQLN